MNKRSVVGGKVLRTPSLGRYDAMRHRAAVAPTLEPTADPFAFNQQFVKDGPRTHVQDKALLVALGVDGDVPLAQARVNAAERRVFPYGAADINGGWISYLRPANDNHPIAALAA